MKRFASDLQTIETSNRIKYNEQIIITKEDNLYQNAINARHLCN